MIGAVAIGVAAGVLAGLVGVGGGILFVPALALLLDLGQLEAEATSLLAMVPVAVAGAWRQRSYGNLRLAEGLSLGALSFAGVGLGVLIAESVSERALEVGFALVTLLVALQLVRRAVGSGDEHDSRAAAA